MPIFWGPGCISRSLSNTSALLTHHPLLPHICQAELPLLLLNSSELLGAHASPLSTWRCGGLSPFYPCPWAKRGPNTSLCESINSSVFVSLHRGTPSQTLGTRCLKEVRVAPGRWGVKAGQSPPVRAVAPKAHLRPFSLGWAAGHHLPCNRRTCQGRGPA